LGLVVSCFDGGGYICVNLRVFYLRESAVDVLLGVTCGSGLVWDSKIQFVVADKDSGLVRRTLDLRLGTFEQ
jgi:hypothetical protein